MKKILMAGTACLTLLSAFPLMAMSSVKDRADIRVDARMDAQTNVDAPCMQTAIRTRDNAMVDAYNAYNQSITTALHTRADAQVAAWANANVSDRTIALQVSEKTFTSSYNTASWQLEKTKNGIRKQFSSDERACKTTGSSSRSSVSSTSTPSSSSTSSSSVACSTVTGKLTGAYSLGMGVPDIGRTYTITASGSVTNIGSVTASGSIRALGFIASGRAMGDITLTQGSSTAVLHLTGPVQTGFSALPTTFDYTVQSATGVFASWTSTTGKLELHLKGDSTGTVSLELQSHCDQ